MAMKIKISKKDTRRRKEVKHRYSEIITPLVVDGVDVTPKALHSIEAKRQIRDVSLSASLTSSIDLTKFRIDLLNEAKKINLSSSCNSLNEDFSVELSDVTKESIGSDARSIEQSQQIKEETDEREMLKNIPEIVNLLLVETETIFLLGIPSSTFIFDATEESQLRKSTYNRRSRKMVDVSIQTLSHMKKTRQTDSIQVKTRSVGVFVTNWRLYDDYNNEDDSIRRSNLSELTPNLDTSSLYSSGNSDDKFLARLVNNRRFHDVVCIIERLLANNYYNNEQKRFKGMLEEQPIVCDNIDYKYRLNLLWTFKVDDVNGMAVVGIALNHNNEDLIAVGYGKYYFTDKIDVGYILIWNIKNPKQPERKYKFKSPVMSLKFSRVNPNLLAVGLYNGVLYVIDISQRYKNVLANSPQFFEPLWSIIWYKLPNEPDEYIMGSFGNGYIIKFQLIDSQRLKYTELMRTSLITGNVRGIEELRVRTNRITQFEKAQKLYKHPTEPYLYYVGTNHGNVFICDTNYLNQYSRVQRLHWSAINAVCSNPFFNKIYLSVGNDYWLRFWIEGETAPFEESRIAIANVQDITWSNTHSTIFITLRGNIINVWDLQRRSYAPQSQMKTPAGLLNTCIVPTMNGECYFIGDIDGNVYVYSLEDIPFKPFFQADALRQCLHKILITQPDVLEKVKKIDTLRYKYSENVAFV